MLNGVGKDAGYLDARESMSSLRFMPTEKFRSPENEVFRVRGYR